MRAIHEQYRWTLGTGVETGMQVMQNAVTKSQADIADGTTKCIGIVEAVDGGKAIVSARTIQRVGLQEASLVVGTFYYGDGSGGYTATAPTSNAVNKSAGLAVAPDCIAQPLCGIPMFSGEEVVVNASSVVAGGTASVTINVSDNDFVSAHVGCTFAGDSNDTVTWTAEARTENTFPVITPFSIPVTVGEAKELPWLIDTRGLTELVLTYVNDSGTKAVTSIGATVQRHYPATPSEV